MEEEQKIGKGVPFEHDTVQETAVEFENIRNEYDTAEYSIR